MKCCILGCKTRPKNASSLGISMHRFPKDSLNKRNWMNAIKILNYNDLENISKPQICSLHFKKEDFINQFGRRLINPVAIPTLHMNNDENAGYKNDDFLMTNCNDEKQCDGDIKLEQINYHLCEDSDDLHNGTTLTTSNDDNTFFIEQRFTIESKREPDLLDPLTFIKEEQDENQCDEVSLPHVNNIYEVSRPHPHVNQIDEISLPHVNQIDEVSLPPTTIDTHVIKEFRPVSPPRRTLRYPGDIKEDGLPESQIKEIQICKAVIERQRKDIHILRAKVLRHQKKIASLKRKLKELQTK